MACWSLEDEVSGGAIMLIDGGYCSRLILKVLAGGYYLKGKLVKLLKVMLSATVFVLLKLDRCR